MRDAVHTLALATAMAIAIQRLASLTFKNSPEYNAAYRACEDAAEEFLKLHPSARLPAKRPFIKKD